MTPVRRPGLVDRVPRGDIAQVVDLVLDRGLVVDAFVRASRAGVGIVTVDAGVTPAGVDTYLRFADATSRIDPYRRVRSALERELS